MISRRLKVFLNILLILIIGVTVLKIKENKSYFEVLTGLSPMPFIEKMKETSDETPREISPAYGNIRTFISTTGKVQPENRLEIKPPISGRIEKVLVREGEKVEAGQILAWMSSTERAALLDAAGAQGKETVEYWQEVYKPASLIAPVSGEVVFKAVEQGQNVTPDDVIIALSDRLIIRARIREMDIGRVKPGQEAIISLHVYSQAKIKGEVARISYEPENMSHAAVYEADILPERLPDVFRSGMGATIYIIEKSKKNILLIPVEAVERDKNNTFVFVNTGNGKSFVKRSVKLGFSDEKHIEVISGINENDRILILPREYLSSQTTESSGDSLIPSGWRKR